MSSNMKNLATMPSDNVVSFAAFAANRHRRPLTDDEPRGKVLLFTGVVRTVPSTTASTRSVRARLSRWRAQPDARE
jgi:hypothetical protein